MYLKKIYTFNSSHNCFAARRCFTWFTYAYKLVNVLSFAAFLLLSTFVSAQNPIAGNQSFQILSEGNFTSTNSHHIHGPLAVGGNLIVNNSSTISEVNMDNTGSYVFTGDGSAPTGLLIKGSITWTTGALKVLDGNYIHIGNSTGSITSNNGGTGLTQVLPTATSYNNAKRIEATLIQPTNVFQTVGFDFTTLFNNYRSTSTTLGSSTNNVQLYNSSNVAIGGNNVSSAQNVRINTLNTGVNYLNLTSSSLNNITELLFDVNAIPSISKVLVINVPITANIVWNNSNMPGLSGVHGPYVIWNFYGGTTYNLTINTASMVVGTVFAPNMNLIKTGTGDIEGGLIAKTMQLGAGEIHNFQFASDLTTTNSCTPPALTASSNSPVNAGGTINLTSISTGGNGAQLVTNGNFSSGNNGFSSDYTFGGGYNITTNPQTVWGWAVNCTNPNGNMIVGDGNGNVNSRFWYQSINVTAGTTYTLSFRAYDFWGGTPAAKLQWGVNGTKTGAISNLSTGGCNTWQEISTAWTATTTGTAIFAIYNNEASGGSNDFAIDDISIVATAPRTYSWSGPLSFTSTNQNPTLSNANTSMSGVYTVTSSVGGCTATAATSVTVNSAFTCSGSCESANLVVNPQFETDMSGWTASNGQLTRGGGGTYGSFLEVNVGDLTGTYAAYQDVTFGANAPYKFSAYVAKHGVNNLPKMYLEFYNGTTYLSKTADILVTKDYDGTFQLVSFEGNTPANTTKIRIVGWTQNNALKFDNLSLVGCQACFSIISPATICVGQSATLTANNCSGTVIWNTGATGSTITVNPTTTTTYTATCNNTVNVLSNPSFETGNLTAWNNWNYTTITSTASEKYSGTYGAKVTASSTGGGFAQDNVAVAGETFTLKAWGKVSSAIPFSGIGIKFMNSSWTSLADVSIEVNATSFQEYTLTNTAPAGTSWVQVYAWTNASTIFYLDNFSLVKTSANTTATATVTVNTAPTVTATGDSECVGATVVLGATGGNTYFWTGPASFTSTLQNPTRPSATTAMAGVYTVTVTSANGCTATATANVAVNLCTTDWNYSCTDNRQVEIIGFGRECQASTSLNITNTANINYIVVEAIYKGTNPGTTINFVANGINYPATRVQPAGTSSNVWVYRTALPSTALVTYTDNSTNCDLQSVVAYIHRTSTGSTQSTGMFTSTSGYNNIQNFTLNIPASTTTRNITVKIPISELTADGRYLRLTATAGTVSNSSFIYGPNTSLGACCLNIVSTTLLNVPSNVTSISISIDTRHSQNGQTVQGQSWVLAGAINAEAVCNCPTVPPAPTVTNGSRCGTGTVTLSAANCSGGTISWFANALGGVSLGTGNSFTTPSISSSTTYHAACVVNGCESNRTAVTATVNVINASITGNTQLCPGANTTTLLAAGGGTYLWNTGATSSSITVSPSVTTNYSATVTNNGCTATVATTVSVAATCCSGTVNTNLVARYRFNEATGATVNDISGNGTPLNLTIQNPANVSWLPSCGLKINTATRLGSGVNATKILTAIQATNAITIEAWVHADNTTQTGPARIVSMSNGTSTRNFTLGQLGTEYNARIRRSTSDNQGFPEIATTGGAVSTSLQHVIVTRDASGNERIYVNGALNYSGNYASNFSNWVDFQLHIGNEQTNDRPWLGTLYMVSIYSGAFSASEVLQNFNAGSTGSCSNCPPPNCTTLPPTPTATGNTRCGNGTTTLSASGCTGTYYWYTGSTGGVAVGIGSPFTTPSLSNTTTYYVECNAVGCTSPRVSATATIISGTGTTPIATVINTGCTGSTGSITVTNLPDGYFTNINGGSFTQYKNSYTDLAAGTYSIGYQGGTCNTYASFTVNTSTDSPLLSLTKTDPTCTTTGNITVSGSGGTTGLGEITYQLWYGISGNSVSNLTSNANYPNSPSFSTTLGIAEGYENSLDNFGGKISGYLIPPTTGTYYLWIASDDYSELWGSGDANPANKILLASVSGWTGFREWNKFTSQKTVALSLVAGQIYYFEALYKEGSGGDNISIGWSKPGESTTAPSEVIPGKYLRPNIASSTTTPVYQYKINSGAFQASNVFNGLAAGTYTVTIQDAGGCTATSNITLTSSGSASAPTTTGASRCGTGTVTLSASGCSGTYNWYAAATGGASLAATASYTTPSISATKTYYVDCTVNSCTSTRVSAVATISSAITASASSNSPVCIGSTINLSASGGTTYSWSGPSSFTSNVQNPSFTATASKGGIYTVTLTGTGGCTATATTNVVVQNVTISNVAVSACINHPLQDVATVNVTIAWSNAPSGDKIKVIINDKIEYIDVAGGATSPQTVTFVVPANGIANNSISAGWVNFQSGNCLTTATYNAPAACSSDNLSCEKILYLCGPDKPSDGDAWDHGFMNYLIAVGSGPSTAAYTKPDASGYGLYNPSNINTTLSVNLNDYTMVIISPTTENNIAPNLLTALKGYSGGILMMNYAQAADLGLTVGNAYYNYQNTAYTNNTNQINVYNYDNISPSFDMVLTGGDYYPVGTGSLWYGLNNASTTNNGINFYYPSSATLSGVPSTHGSRVYLGFHMNGIYANAQNGGAMPAPITSYFTPSKHLTLEAKVLFDQAIKNVANGVKVTANGDTKCAGATINLTSTGVGISTYAWTGPNSFTTNLQNPTIANATSVMGGIYTITVTSSTGCTATATANVVINTTNPPTSSGASRCNAGTLTLSASGCSGTYKWYNVASGGTVLSSSATYTTPSLSTTTNYYVSCTVGGCVSSRATVIATINTPPTATASSNSPVTIGGTLNLFSTGGDTYAWTGPNGFASTEQNSSNSGVTSLNAGIYTVTVTSNGCTATATTEVIMSNYDPGDIDCSIIPVLNFVNPTLISGTALANGAKYRFSNVTSGTDAILTIVSRTHSDIVIFNLDLPASSYGGYDAAFQPMIDYNWINGGGSFDAPGEKSVTFKFDFVDAGTTNPKVLPNLLATGIDIDGSGNEVREFIQASGYQSYQTQSPSSLTLSGALKAKGPLANYAGINELALDAMISFGYINSSSITITYGGDWNGSTPDFVDYGAGNSDENRLNSLYFKCYNFNTTVCALPLAAPSATGNTRCGNGPTTLSASGCTGTYYWYTGSTGGVAVGIGSSFTTPSISNTTTYYVECNAVGCTSPRTSATATVIPNPVVTITGDVECVGSTIALSATGGGTYAWTGPNSFASTLQNPTRPNATTAMAGVYTLTVTANGCSTVATTNVTVSTNPTPTITGTTTICNGQATTLTAAGGNYYVWSDGSTSAAVTVSPTSNTTYTATVYQNSVTSTNLITNVTNFNASNFNYINSVNSYADASSLFDNIDNTGGATFHASRVTSGLDWGISYNLGGSFLINNLSIDRRNDCCTDRGEGGVMQVWRNGAMVYQSNILSGTGDIVLAATPAPNVVGDEVRYVFLAGANSLTGEGLLNFSEWIIGGTKLCSATATKNIVVNAIPSAPTSAGNSRCGTGTVALSASGCTGGTISWYSTLTGGSALTTGANYTTPNLSSTTTYYIECSQNSCVSTTRNSAVATVNTIPTPTANSTGACVGGTIALSAMGGSTYSWTGPSSFSSLTQNPSRSGATVAMTGYYVVTVTSSGGCTATANTYVQVSTISASATNISCNNNGTLSNSTDDYFTFLLTPSGNLGGRFTISASQGINPIAVTLSDGNATGSLSYAYPIPLRVPNGKAGGGNVTLTLTDVQNPSCSFNVIVADPGTCNAANCTGTTQTVSYTYRIPLGSTELTQVPINLPKFDNTGGTKILTKVDLKYGMNEVTTGYIENQAASSSTIDIALSGSESIQLGATTLKSIPINFTTSTTLPAQIIVPAQGNYIGDSAYVVFGNTKYSTLYRMNNWLSKVIDDIYINPQTDARWVTNATGNATHDDDIYIIPVQTFSFYDSTTFTTPTDLTQFIGAGNIGLTASTDNNLNLTGGGGNNVFFQRTKAYAYATVTYSYVCCIPPIATSASSNSAICSGQSINLTASSTGGTAYSWSGPNGFTSTLQNPIISGATTLRSGIYTVTIVGVGTCTATATTNVVVNAIPASPTSAGNSRCGTGTVVLSASGCAGGTISWYSTLTGGSALTTGANYTTPSLSSTTTYYIECSQNSCVSTSRNSAVATVNTIPTASATGDTECVGGIIVLNSSGGTSYSWTGPNSFTSNIQNPTIANGQVANAGVYTVTIISSAGCSASATANVVLNVIPSSPTSSGNARCGTGTVALTASGCTGGTISWYSTLTGGSALTTGANYTTPSLSSTTTYYIECSQNSCVSTSRNSAVATVNTIPTASATGDTECVGSTIVLNSSGGNTYSWTGPSSFSSTLQNPTISNGQTVNAGIYTVTIISSAGCSASATANVVVNVIPSSPTSSGNARCGTGTVALSASGCAGGTISWYSTLTGGSALTTGANYTTPSLSSTTTYYIECAQNSCVSTTRNSAVATVNTIPTASATGDTECVGSTIVLNSSGGNTYSWTGPSSFSSTLQNPTISNGQTVNAGIYTVTVTSSAGCSATATANVVVNVIPASPTSVGNSRCGTGTVALSASGCAGGTISWYSTLTGGSALTTGANYTTPSLSSTTTYYIECSQNSCVSATRNSAVATVNTIPTASATSNAPIIGGTLNLYATGGGTYSWTGPNGFTSTLKDVSISPVTANMANVYTVTVNVNGCTATATTEVALLTNDPGEIDCSLIPTLNFTNPALISGIAGANNAQYRFSNVTGGTDAIVTIMSRSHANIDIIDLDIPAASFGGYDAAMQPIIDYNWINGDGTFNAAGERSVTFKIDFVVAGTTTPKIMPNFIASGIDIDGSGDEVREFIQSSGYQSHQIQTPTSLTLSGALKAKGSYANYVGINELALDAVISYAYINTSSITITYGAEWNGNTANFADNVNPTMSDERRLNSLYFKCENLNTTVCDVVLVPPTGVPASRCGTGTVTLSASGCSGIYLWYNVATGGTSIGSSSTFVTPSISGSTTYYVECNAVGCTSNRSSVIATINTIPVAPTVASNGICGPGIVTLSGSNCTGGTISWFNSQSGGTSIGTGNTYTTPTLSASVVYFASCTNANNCVSTTRNYGVATINPIPAATLTAINSMCLGNVASNNGKLLLSKFETSSFFSYNIGSTYNSGTASAFAAIPANGTLLSNISDPNTSITYSVRIKNSSNCIIDLNATFTNKCSQCPAGYCEPANVVKTK